MLGRPMILLPKTEEIGQPLEVNPTNLRQSVPGNRQGTHTQPLR